MKKVDSKLKNNSNMEYPVYMNIPYTIMLDYVAFFFLINATCIRYFYKSLLPYISYILR